MKIVVLVKEVPDTYEARKLDSSGMLARTASELVPDEINERALESALRYQDAHKGTEVVVLSMGPESTVKTLRKMLSMGADSAVLVEDSSLAGADLVRTSAVLAAAVQREGFDLIVAGNESTDGRGGLVPAMVAEHLGLPLLPSLDTLEITAESVSGSCAIDGGTLVVNAALPAVVSVTERSAEARFPNFKGIMKAKKKPLAKISLADLGLSPEPGARSTVTAAVERPVRAAGTKIVDEGQAAQELADFLAANRLI
ncbi:electron transfer flavoprotein subunit beta/FixA family protein [Arthrobacter sp. I2-34]|uniref:Electron transfer flavoprotein subunit beta n=1 Tax=Arthrobacter hankyongi TaxID=2904801 RepID=A0ABS9L3X8_9MICC|nr:electron transfer flavoprotein subunit beta/FixA family protein [Arthrobacter hankyongi]MCG2621258.1 electron transfer flavoprotein subunit beta/FixA family protein [Arthrobacter hankyongi]